jgi:hypothetical protein
VSGMCPYGDSAMTMHRFDPMKLFGARFEVSHDRVACELPRLRVDDFTQRRSDPVRSREVVNGKGPELSRQLIQEMRFRSAGARSGRRLPYLAPWLWDSRWKCDNPVLHFQFDLAQIAN